MFLVHCPSSVLEDKEPAHPSFEYREARKHEIKPHRRTIPMHGVKEGFNQLHLTLTVSPVGNVLSATAQGDKHVLSLWPQLQDEVTQWKFEPFEQDDKPVTAEVEEHVDLVPPERLPSTHVLAPALRPNSKISITLRRSGCFGSCPSYSVTVDKDGIEFQGGGNVVAAGRHRDVVDHRQLRELADRFLAADFYSMNAEYVAGVTDNPTYELSITIDNRTKKVVDYVGSWVGMPSIITELEDAVDEFTGTQRWIDGAGRLVQALQSQKFNFHTFEAQVMLKEAAVRGKAQTLKELLEAGVPLTPLPAPKPKEPYMVAPFQDVGWLNAASENLDTLQVLLNAGASKNDQHDKDLALARSARSGNVESVRVLIAYGANPNADFRRLTVTEKGAGMTISEPGAGSVLIYAPDSGNPEVVREILSHKPNLEEKDK